MRRPATFVGSMLVRNEDVYVEQALRNVVGFCDVVEVFDHDSADATWDILRDLAREYDHVHVHRTKRAGDSHRPLERYAGTRAWVLGVDGDELFDPTGLAALRDRLEEGDHDDVFRLKGHVFNCVGVDREALSARGYMSPPSRPVTKLFNFGVVRRWEDCTERLHFGRQVFLDGFSWESMRVLSDTTTWETDPLRLLHTCFVRRSSLDPGDGAASRDNLDESGLFDRSWVGGLRRRLRPYRADPKIAAMRHRGLDWKQTMYRKGEELTIDASAFF
jgi:hypothetical protein